MHQATTIVKNAPIEKARMYWLTLGMTLVIGFCINYLMIKSIPAETVNSINPLVLIIGYFIICFAGITLSKTSDIPLFSFIGYLMVVVPVGIVIIPFVKKYDPQIVERAAVYTALLSGLMTCAGSMFPSFFKSIGGILFWSLLGAIIAEIAMAFMGFQMAIMDYIVALIFLGFIGYDYSMALEDDATIDAAIDRAVALYLDIINLFLRILSITGNDD